MSFTHVHSRARALCSPPSRHRRGGAAALAAPAGHAPAGIRAVQLHHAEQPGQSQCSNGRRASTSRRSSAWPPRKELPPRAALHGVQRLPLSAAQVTGSTNGVTGRVSGRDKNANRRTPTSASTRSTATSRTTQSTTRRPARHQLLGVNDQHLHHWQGQQPRLHRQHRPSPRSLPRGHRLGCDQRDGRRHQQSRRHRRLRYRRAGQAPRTRGGRAMRPRSATGATSAQALGVNDNDEVVGAHQPTGHLPGFTWTSARHHHGIPLHHQWCQRSGRAGRLLHGRRRTPRPSQQLHHRHQAGTRLAVAAVVEPPATATTPRTAQHPPAATRPPRPPARPKPAIQVSVQAPMP